jgi:hypothetical protein
MKRLVSALVTITTDIPGKLRFITSGFTPFLVTKLAALARSQLAT